LESHFPLLNAETGKASCFLDPDNASRKIVRRKGNWYPDDRRLGLEAVEGSKVLAFLRN
jgi:hypothetical protein